MLIPAIILATVFNFLILIMIIAMHIVYKRPLYEFKKLLGYYILVLIMTWLMMFMGFYEYTTYLW